MEGSTNTEEGRPISPSAASENGTEAGRPETENRIPETVAPSEVYPLQTFPEKVPRTYSLAEYLSFLLYVVLSIVLAVVAGLEFAHHAKVDLNGPATAWDESSAAFKKDVAPVIEANWSVSPTLSVGSSRFTAAGLSFSVHKNDVRVHPFAKTYTSVFLEADVPLTELTASSNVLSLDLKTERNTLTITRTIQTIYDNTSFVIDNCGTGTSCAANTSKACTDRYGTLALAPFPVNATTAVLNCSVPTYTGKSCIILQSRRNDTGDSIWWEDFDLDGCEWPYTSTAAAEKHYIRTKADSIPVRIYVGNDPKIQKEFLSEGRTFAVEIIRGYTGNSPNPFLAEKHDRTPEAVGIALLACVFIVGCVYMGLRLIPFAVTQLREGKRLFPKSESSSAESSPMVSKSASMRNSPKGGDNDDRTEE